jgi:hypothetical protein
MDSPTPPTVRSESRRIVIEGLERPDNVDGVGSQENTDGKSSSSTFSMIMHEDDLLSELWNRVEGYRYVFLAFISALTLNRVRLPETRNGDNRRLEPP